MDAGILTKVQQVCEAHQKLIAEGKDDLAEELAGDIMDHLLRQHPTLSGFGLLEAAAKDAARVEAKKDRMSDSTLQGAAMAAGMMPRVYLQIKVTQQYAALPTNQLNRDRRKCKLKKKTKSSQKWKRSAVVCAMGRCQRASII